MFKAEKKKSLTQLNLPVILWAVLVTHKWKNSKSADKASTVAFLRFYTFFHIFRWSSHPNPGRFCHYKYREYVWDTFEADKKTNFTQLNLPVILWAFLVTHKWKNSKSADKAYTVAFVSNFFPKMVKK